jgi:hypothetical protein
MFKSLRLSLAALSLGVASLATAQDCPSIVDIALVPNQNNQLEVWLRPQSNFDGYFASISFTVRWMNGEATLGGLSQEMLPYFSIGTSGPEHVDGPFRYQIYAGFGGAGPLSSFGLEWLAGEEVLLTRINIASGNSYFQIVQDEWTSDPFNNGDYYISLNGLPCVGEIYSFTTAVADAVAVGPTVQVSPNPSTGTSSVTVDLVEQSDLQFELRDATGRVVFQKARNGRNGQHVEQLYMEHFAEGTYTLQVRVGASSFTRRLVLVGTR